MSQHQDLIEEIQRFVSPIIETIEAMPEEMLAASHGKSRTGLDIAYETMSLIRAVADRTVAKPGETVMTKLESFAPDGYTKAQALVDLKRALSDVCEGLATMTKEQAFSTVESPFGPVPVIAIASSIPMHTMYHDGQLNFIQTIYGDQETHW